MTSLIKQQHGVVLHPHIEMALKPTELELIVSKMTGNSYACFYNKSFEDRNFVFILNNQWCFWDSLKDEIVPWNWTSDIDEIIQGYVNEQDNDAVEEFCNGWTISDIQEFPQDLDDVFEFKTLPTYLNVTNILAEVQTKEEKALTIMKIQGLTDLERVQRILALN